MVLPPNSDCGLWGLFALLCSAVYLGILGYYDLKSRNIPDALVYSYLATGLVVFSVNTAYMFGHLPLLFLLAYPVFSSLVTTLPLYILYRFRYVGDGDVFVVLATGLVLSYPSTYCGTVQRFGIIPPGLVVLLYSSFVVVARIVYDVLVNLIKYRTHVQRLPGIYKFIVPLLARPARVSDLRSGTCGHVFVVEFFEEVNGQIKRSFRFAPKIADENDLRRAMAILERYRVEYVWVTPAHPFVSCMFMGLVLFAVLGDSLVLAMFGSLGL